MLQALTKGGDLKSGDVQQNVQHNRSVSVQTEPVHRTFRMIRQNMDVLHGGLDLRMTSQFCRDRDGLA